LKEYPKFVQRVKARLPQPQMNMKFAMGKQNSLLQPLRRSLADAETLRPVIRFLFNPLRDKMSPVCRPFHTGLDNRTSIRRPVAGDLIE
jgi:hypothetical protein